MLSKYLNPQNDVSFKKIFGTESHKQVLIRFVNTILELEGPLAIEDVTYLNPFQAPRHEKAKQSIVDVLVKDKRNIRYIVEMQLAHTPFFQKRAQYYAAKTYVAQLSKGESYPKLNQVYFIAIANAILFPEKASYKSLHLLKDDTTGEHDLQDFSFTFIELPKFKKQANELKGIEDQWLYFLKHAAELDHIPAQLQDPAIQEAFTILERFAWSEQELLAYEDAQLAIGDEIIGREWNYAKGKTEGKAEGLAEGLEKGKKEGRAEGEEKGLKKGEQQGIQKEKVAIAKQMLQEGLDNKLIARVTGLSVQQIGRLRRAT